MSFDLRNDAQMFQRHTCSIAPGLDFVHVYVDDLLVALPNKDEHIQHSPLLFQRLSGNRILANPDKCEHSKIKLTFIGQEITRGGIKPSDDEVRAIVDYDVPSSIKKRNAFLEPVNIYRLNAWFH